MPCRSASLHWFPLRRLPFPKSAPIYSTCLGPPGAVEPLAAHNQTRAEDFWEDACARLHERSLHKVSATVFYFCLAACLCLNPDPPILAFFLFLFFFRFAVFLAFLCVFPFSSSDFKASADREILAFSGRPCFLPNKTRIGGSGNTYERLPTPCGPQPPRQENKKRKWLRKRGFEQVAFKSRQRNLWIMTRGWRKCYILCWGDAGDQV